MVSVAFDRHPLRARGGDLSRSRDVTLARASSSGEAAAARRSSSRAHPQLRPFDEAFIAAESPRVRSSFFTQGPAERICGYKAADVIGKMSVRRLYSQGVA